MAFARKILAVLTVLALTLAPVNTALAARAPAHAGMHGSLAMHMTGAHAAHQHAATGAAHHCQGAGGGCCDDNGACGDTCVQKCFGQLAVVPPVRTVQLATTELFTGGAAQQPPGLTAAPQPPPPRA